MVIERHVRADGWAEDSAASEPIAHEDEQRGFGVDVQGLGVLWTILIVLLVLIVLGIIGFSL
jgi:hypothetical protein